MKGIADLSGTEWTAERVLAELTPGMRMRILFDTAKAATWLAPDELATLFAQPSFEARMAAFCILDFQARKRLGLFCRGGPSCHGFQPNSWVSVGTAPTLQPHGSEVSNHDQTDEGMDRAPARQADPGRRRAAHGRG
jgi:hypothetical protein